VKPDIQCDFRELPFANESFWHIVFDPPHMIRVGKNSWTREKYGALDATWPQMIHDGFNECWRVLKPNGTLIFKWSSVQIPLSELLKHIDQKPLYGHKSGKHMNTHWLAFFKESEEKAEG
jgi:ubiquinone/menaquinone biosynthesis C-methylase UbiE